MRKNFLLLSHILYAIYIEEFEEILHKVKLEDLDLNRKQMRDDLLQLKQYKDGLQSRKKLIFELDLMFQEN
jgi:hypothetical protein